MSIKINRYISKYNFYPNRVDKYGRHGTPQFIVIHYVGALGGAKDNCIYYAGGDRGASAHFYTGFQGEVWQSIEIKDGSWSVGVNENHGKLFGICTNLNSINIEMCVRKKDSKHLVATDHDWYFENATVKSTVELTVYLMKKYNIDIDHVVRHYDVCGKICPNPYVYNDGKHTWSEFLSLVKKALGDQADQTEPETPKKYYRVGTAWANGKCVGQIGAYEDLSNAKKTADSVPIGSTYKVFDDTGKAVYSRTGSADPETLTVEQLSGLSEQTKISIMAPLYMKCAKDTGMLASVGLAQFCLESGYGTTALSIKANNLHGMKCSLSGNSWPNSKWDGKSKVTLPTQEEVNGKMITIHADFRKYPRCLDSIYDRAAYFIGAKNGSELRYPGIAEMTDAEEQVRAIKAGHYATDSRYVEKLMSIITRFNLTQYDTAIPKKPSRPQPKTKVLFRVQVGAFKNEANAKALQKTLKAEGFDTMIANNGGFYRVQCGAFSEEKNATALVEKLKKSGHEAIIKKG